MKLAMDRIAKYIHGYTFIKPNWSHSWFWTRKLNFLKLFQLFQTSSNSFQLFQTLQTSSNFFKLFFRLQCAIVCTKCVSLHSCNRKRLPYTISHRNSTCRLPLCRGRWAETNASAKKRATECRTQPMTWITNQIIWHRAFGRGEAKPSGSSFRASIGTFSRTPLLAWSA